MRKQGEPLWFSHIYTWLADRVAKKTGLGARAIWEALQLPKGKITLADLRQFNIDFLSARRNLSDVGEGGPADI